MEENNNVNLNENPTVETTDKENQNQKEPGKKGGMKTVLKAVGKGLMYIGIGAATVFGVFAILGKAGVLPENGNTESEETEDGGEVQEGEVIPMDAVNAE